MLNSLSESSNFNTSISKKPAGTLKSDHEKHRRIKNAKIKDKEANEWRKIRKKNILHCE